MATVSRATAFAFGDWEQHAIARQWVAAHQPCVDALMALHGVEVSVH